MRRAFTLVELLVVLAIMAMIMGVALVAFSGTRASARDAKRKTDLESIRSALEIYRSENRGYPTSLGTLVPDFIAAVPADPTDPASRYYYAGLNCAGVACPTYELCAALERTAGQGSGGCLGTNNCGATCNLRTTSP